MKIGVSETTFKKNVRQYLKLEVSFTDFKHFSLFLKEKVRKIVLEEMSANISKSTQNLEILRKMGISSVRIEDIFVYTGELDISNSFLKEIILSGEAKKYLYFKDPAKRNVRPETKKNSVRLYLLEKVINSIEEFNESQFGSKIFLSFPSPLHILEELKGQNSPYGLIAGNSGRPEKSSRYINAKSIDPELYLSDFDLTELNRDLKEILIDLFENRFYWNFYRLTHDNDFTIEEIKKKILDFIEDYFKAKI